jgi:CheY-like chemotaxis protein
MSFGRYGNLPASVRYADAFATLLAAVPCGAHLKDPHDEFRYTWWNDGMVQLTGLSARRVVGRTDTEVFAADLADWHAGDDSVVMQTRRVLQRTGEVGRYGATGRVTNLRKLPLLDDAGEVVLLLTLVEDVTPAATVGPGAGAAVVPTVAGDLRNLLQVIMGYGELMREQFDDARLRRDLELTMLAARRAERLVSGLLDADGEVAPAVVFSAGGAAASGAPATESTEPAERPRPVVLLADDQDDVRRFCRATLERAGFEVLEAEDGAQAVEIYRAQPDRIDALVFDVVMPRMDGVSAYASLRDEGAQAPVLFCSGFVDEALLAKHPDLAGMDILAKPFRPGDLVEGVQQVLGMAPSGD